MSAKIIHTLSDENPELHKKIGCMNGICQLFEGQRFHHSWRFAGHSHHKKLPTGRSQTRENGSEPSRTFYETMEKTALRAAKAKLTLSSGSSKSHDSSSCYSSIFSSADNCRRTTQLEPHFFDNRMLQETQTHAHKTQMYQSNSPSEQSWEQYGLPDFVKDSIHREARRVMIRATSEEEKWRPKLSYIDSPRPSYYEREMRSRVRMKLKELPRLSVDDKEQFSSLDWQQEPGRQGRTSSVVVKLMGLEMLPDPISPVAETGLLSRFPRTDKNSKQNCRINSTRPFRSEAATPRENITDFQKPVVMDEFGTVPSPWKQPDDIEDSYITTPKSPRKLLNKILAQIQSTALGKGPRASRGVVKAIEKAKKMLEAGKDRSVNYKFLQNSSSPALTTNIAMDSMKNSFKSQTMAMEPTRLRDESTSKTPPESHKKHTSGSKTSQKHNRKQTAEDILNHHRESPSRPSYRLNKNTSARLFQPAQEFSTLGKKQRNHSLQQKLVKEEQHHQAVPLTDTSNKNTHPRGLQSESGSTIRKDRPKLQIPEPAESSVDQSERSHRIYATSRQSKSNRGTMRCTSSDVARKYEKCMTGDASVKHTPWQKNCAPGIRDEGLRPDPVEVVVQEQPSPVSVLDATFCEDESPSPMKMTSRAFKDEEQLNAEEAARASKEEKDYSHSKGINLSFKHDPDLVLANSTPEEEVIQENAILHKSEDTEHKYIFEILSISGILKDPESNLITTLLKPSSLPLNPNLFLALEQAKASMELEKGRDNESGQIQNAKKVKRKLIFDTVNEILAQRTVFGGFSKEVFPLRVLLGKKAKGRLVLKTLRSEIDRLQAQNLNCNLDYEDYSLKSICREDLVHQETERIDFRREIPGIAWDVERLIFKDLISEVVGGEIAAVRDYLLHRPSFVIIP